MLWWKLLLTPVMIAGLTLIGRRWGPRAAGLIVGLPLTTGPVSVFLATEHGIAFAERAAIGSVLGFMNACCCVAAFAVTLRRKSLSVAVAVAVAVVAGSSLAVGELTVSMPVAISLAMPVIVFLWLVVRRPIAAEREHVAVAARIPAAPAWDILARMLIATSMVASITAAASVLGPRMSGVLSALPVLGGLLAVFTYQRDGRAASVALIAAMIIGSIPGILFFAAAAGLLGRLSLFPTYGAAAAVAVVSGALISKLTRVRAQAEPSENGIVMRHAA